MATVTNNENRYIPANTNQGWGIIGLVLLLAVGCIVGASYLHKKTYKHPTDPSWHGIQARD